MKIAILSRSSALYSTQSIVRACLRRGHEVEIIDHMSVDLLIKDGELEIHSNGVPVGPVDAIIPRIGSSVTSMGRSEEHTSELQSRGHLVCRLLHETKNTQT